MLKCVPLFLTKWHECALPYKNTDGGDFLLTFPQSRRAATIDLAVTSQPSIQLPEWLTTSIHCLSVLYIFKTEV